ncbi:MULTISPECIES: lipid-A-disaccharide synthase [unclassified Nitratiruptor]|uniref:lipid-A-disaccharide synthase n=1 Tax=unclassified Nitratiruptor TaxID=2624044 RepID=UPI00191656D6|nr:MULTISPECIES: lipid-A-disaccharide synthase [unclassified Nitratiruptor]BCD60630.1 lipid-A-disaccharide synthase [Nitratiruptor sp. YY08-10]BCD64561.1 lipid-A-disaccharide synthase [Nitratiruptor sp. YY08-14]
MKLLVSVLERSANIHLASLLPHLDDVEIQGIFDKELGNPVMDLQSLAVMGFVDAVKKISLFQNLQKDLVTMAADADKVLLMDSSGFNIPLAKKIKKAYPNKPIIYYILPQVWAWRPKRAEVLEKYIDQLCAIWPFESKFYSCDAPIRFAGHPLLDQIKEFKKEPIQSDIIAFLPGSRRSEIKRLMPVFQEVRKRLSNKEALLVVPKHFAKENLHELYGDTRSFTIVHNTHKALYKAEFAFICSGTATLESTLIGTPFILSYIANSIDFAIAKLFVHLRYAGIANILAESITIDPIHPEYLQNEVTPQNLLKAYNEYNTIRFYEKSSQIRSLLKYGSAKNVAEIIQKV